MLDAQGFALIELLKRTHPEREGLDAQMREVVEEVERSGQPLMEVIENYQIFTREEVLQTMANELGTYIWEPRAKDVELAVLNMIDVTTARTYGVIPIEFDQISNTVELVMRNPLDIQSVDSISFILGHTVHPVVADDDTIDNELERYYPEKVENVHDLLQDFQEEEEIIDEREIESKANETPIIKFVDVIMAQAIKDKASDIHFEPYEDSFRIRYRVDGALYEMPPPPKSLALPVISRVKIISGLNISERRRPQDGRIQLKIAGRPIDLRVSCLPTSYGESVVLRVLDRSVVNLDLDVLGIGQDILEKLREIIHLPNGILLVTGPTGSGKTTTLYSCLKEVNVVSDKLLTAEDPVEYNIEGIMQLPINDAVGMTFHRALRAFLRQDPDKILVGEIRDFETAQIAIEASLTGHFVFSTLHTNDSASTITRLVDMGIEPFLICSSLVAVLAQRLVRRVCSNCHTTYVPTDEELVRMNIEREDVGDRRFAYGKGCSICNGTGYKGRKALCELLVVTPQIRDLIADNAPMTVLKEKARELGMRTLREDGILSVLNGDTTVDEIMRYT